MTNENSWSILEDQLGKPTAADFRQVVEQKTGIEFEPDSPYNMTKQDWEDLVRFLETEVGDTADNSETEGGME